MKRNRKKTFPIRAVLTGPILTGVILTGAMLTGVLILAGIQSGCTNSGTATPQSGSGVLSGTVKAYAANASRTIDPSGILVSVQGTSLSGTSNAQGSFSIENIPAGVYNIIFSKQGFDSMIYPVHHMLGVGTDVINDAFLLQGPGDSAVFDAVSMIRDSSTARDSIRNVANSLTIMGHLSGIDTAAGVDLIVSSDTTFTDSIDISNFEGIFSSGQFSAHVSFETLSRSVNIASGSVFYIWGRTISIPISAIPTTTGEYQSYSTIPLGKLTRYRFVVP